MGIPPLLNGLESGWLPAVFEFSVDHLGCLGCPYFTTLISAYASNLYSSYYDGHLLLTEFESAPDRAHLLWGYFGESYCVHFCLQVPEAKRKAGEYRRKNGGAANDPA